MAKTNPARSPKRIRRWLQTTAVGTVLVSSSLFGLIAVQGANATAHEAADVVPSATPWSWPSQRSTPPAAAPGIATVQATTVSRTTSSPIAVRTPVVTSTAAATPPAPATTPTVRARTRAS